MREITMHKGNALNDAIKIVAPNPPGPSGANNEYELSGAGASVRLEFHAGPAATGWKGLSTEALFAIGIDRLEGQQRGPFPCKDNEDALGLFKDGLTCLKKRTAVRQAQNVEGKNVPHVEGTAFVGGKPAGEVVSNVKLENATVESAPAVQVDTAAVADSVAPDPAALEAAPQPRVGVADGGE